MHKPQIIVHSNRDMCSQISLTVHTDWSLCTQVGSANMTSYMRIKEKRFSGMTRKLLNKSSPFSYQGKFHCSKKFRTSYTVVKSGCFRWGKKGCRKKTLQTIPVIFLHHMYERCCNIKGSSTVADSLHLLWWWNKEQKSLKCQGPESSYCT